MGTERLMMGTERMRSGQRASAHARYRISVGMRIAVLSTNIDIVWCPGGLCVHSQDGEECWGRWSGVKVEEGRSGEVEGVKGNVIVCKGTSRAQMKVLFGKVPPGHRPLRVVSGWNPWNSL